MESCCLGNGSKEQHSKEGTHTKQTERPTRENRERGTGFKIPVNERWAVNYWERSKKNNKKNPTNGTPHI